MSNRLTAMRRLLAQSELDAVLISQSDNRRYLSGFTGSAGFLFITRDKALLITDFRYIDQAQSEAPAFDIVRIQGSNFSWFPPLVAELGIKKLGFEGRDITFNTYRQLTGGVSGLGSEISLIPTDGTVESLRAIKDDGEVSCIERAAALADAALEEILPQAEPGVSEKEMAWRLESRLRRGGSEPLPFDVIVAAGPRAAMPHAKPTDRAVLENEPVVIDFGARVGGYACDITRTVCLGEGDSTFYRIYDIVLGAQLTAIATMQPGMTGDQADRLGRVVVAEAGYEENFGHGLGHGIGLAAHEEPRLGPGSDSVLSEGMVFTIEPGIYLSGWGGVRIEDTVVLREGKVQPLTRAMKIRRKPA